MGRMLLTSAKYEPTHAPQRRSEGGGVAFQLAIR